jgi:hypothetical protein
VSDSCALPLAGASGAAFSPCRRYRYALWRVWRPGLPRILFVGLNPSRANERLDDPTIRRCIGFAQSWGYGGLLVGNLFAWRAADPRLLKRAAEPLGLENEAWLDSLAGAATRILVCWGRHGGHLERDRWFAARHPGLWCLRENLDGSPAHPLYMRKQQRPRPWRPPNLPER